jgi:hypothetical protein
MLKFKILALIGAVMVLLGFGYKAGYNRAVVKLNKMSQKAVEEAVSAFKVESDQTLARMDKERQEALRLSEKLQNRPKEVEIREVTKIVESDACKSLSDDYIQLLNTTIEYYSGDGGASGEQDSDGKDG